MAIKKSDLYSHIWASCDELRGGMDASQYKDYVLVLLFVKYVSDRYAGQAYAPIAIPKGATFADMVALKGKPDIGDQINKKILAPLAQAAQLSDVPDFNDPSKLGSGKEMVERLTNLIAIFENQALDFSKNRADGDDLLGDAYEFLMRHFATESGKSKGQFYTPAEVSRTIAQILGIRSAKTTNDTTVYDPTCGSGSLLLKVGAEAHHGKDVKVTLYGQEKDNATAGLARMNMILHDYATAEIKQENTLANPLYRDGDALKTFDYVVANPPFSDKRWSTGLDAEHDPWQRTALYKSTASLVRAYANISDDLAEAGYTQTQILNIKTSVERFVSVRDIIRQASGETIDLKAYEADMRHLIDTYIEADAPRTISDFGEVGLLDLIVKSGMAEAINQMPEAIKGDPRAVAETIANNVRRKIIKENLNDPAFYDRMSVLLNEILADLRARRIDYAEFLKRIAELAKQVQTGTASDTPEKLNTPGKRAIYNFLKREHGAATASGNEGVDEALDLALQVDETVRRVRPNSFRGNLAKENVIKAALLPLLGNNQEMVERVFLIIKAQTEY